MDLFKRKEITCLFMRTILHHLPFTTLYFAILTVPPHFYEKVSAKSMS